MSTHSDLQHTILDYLNWLPMTFAFPTHDARHKPTEKGVTDIICCHRGKCWAIEIKVGKDKMRADQDDFGRAIVEAGGVHAVVSSLDQMMSCIPERKR